MRAIYAVYVALVLFAGAMTWVVLRGEDTRKELRIVQHGPAVECVHGDVGACRRLARALKAADGRKPDAARKGSSGRTEGTGPFVPRGGGAIGSPTGGGPIGRVPSPGDSPPADQPSPSPPPAPSEPLIDLDAPLVPRTCVGDLLAVNCP